MLTPIPDLTALIACLDAAQEGQPDAHFLRLRSDLFGAAGVLAGCFGPQVSELRIDQLDAGTPLIEPYPASNPTEVRIVGLTKPFTHGNATLAYATTITGTVPTPDAPLLVLEAEPHDSGWTLVANFPTFPQYQGTDGPSTAWKPSFFDQAAMSQAVFRASTATAASLALVADLDLDAGPLAELGAVLPHSTLTIKGTVQPRDTDFPVLTLTGPVADYSIERLAELSLELVTTTTGGPDGKGESVVFLAGTTQVGSLPSLWLRAPVLQSSTTWALEGGISDPERYSLGAGLTALVDYAGGHQQLALPEGLDLLSSLHLVSVSVAITAASKPRIESVGFRVATAAGLTWTAPLLGLTISDFGIYWFVLSPFDKPSLIGGIDGLLRLGPESDAPRLLTAVDLSGLDAAVAPDVSVSADLDPTYPIRLDQLFRTFTGADLGLDLQVSALSFAAETGPRTMRFMATLSGDWPLPVPLVEFQGMQFLLQYGPSGYSGSVMADVALAGFPFFAAADYRGADKGWLFSGGLRPDGQPLVLQVLVNKIAGQQYPELPANLGKIELRKLLLSFDTASEEFSFDGVAGWLFDFRGLDLTVDIEAELSITSRPGKPTLPASPLALPAEPIESAMPTDSTAVVLDGEPARVYSGFARGTLTVNDFLVSVIYSFDVEKSTTLSFSVTYRALTLLCELSKNADDQTILRAGLTGVSFGDLVEYLVGLADPQADVKLTAPWDVLYQLRFDDLSLEVNFTTKAVGFRYAPKVNLGIVRLDAISLVYLKRAGQSGVDIEIEGEFLGQEYDEKNPLSWDLLNDPAPAPPGKADQLLDLRFLGVGQNITFRETASFKRVRDVIDAMEAGFAEVTGDENPLESLPELKFSGDGSWLIGADFTVMSAVSLMGVFADPVLYGLRVGLAGEKVKSLAGLEFEILYKKVTDTVGVYSVELTLPDAMRQLEFGAVSVTLPIIGIDIYTNGSFRVDLGFPANGDFSRSFCVQAGPFIGYGGFYFALLNGDTSSAVPRVRNGSFTPVIEAGLGLSVGVGRTLDKGVLKAGATLTVQAIIEGVLGWFNPDDRSQPTAIFYRLQGTASIVGKVFGQVDLVVVKASISITAYAAVTLSLEAYKPIVVRLELGVEVSASATILFIEITFSFRTTLDLSFEIGQASNTPWLEATEDPPHLEPRRLGGQRRRLRASAPTPTALLRRVAERTEETSVFDWSPRPVFADGTTVEVDLLLVPSLTPAIASHVTHALRTVLQPNPSTASTSSPPPGTPAVQVVMSLVVPTGTPASARHADEVLRVEGDAADAAFNRLAEGVLRWAVTSLTTSSDAAGTATADQPVTADALAAIASFLADRANREAVFTYERVTGLIEQNFVLRVSNPVGPSGTFHHPRSDAPRAAGATAVQGAVFPMIPEVRMAPQGQPAVEFWRYACTDAAYRQFLDSYYDQLTPAAPAGSGDGPGDPDRAGSRRPTAGPVGLSSGPLRSTPVPAGCGDDREPLSAVLFADYFAMLAQQGVQSAADLMRAYPYEPTGTETLLEVAQGFGGVNAEYATRPGDTPATVAAAFGLSIDDLRELNSGWLGEARPAERLPHGSVLAVTVGPTVARIAAANADYPLTAKARLTVKNGRYPIKDRATLASIATSFALPGPQSFVQGSAAVNATTPGLLRADAALPIPPTDVTVTNDDRAVPDQTVDRIAASHFVRAGQRTGGPDVIARVAWYASSINRLNGTTFSGTVQIPVAELVGSPPQLRDTGATTPYEVSPSDTVTGVATVFELLQVSAADPTWTAYRSKVTVSPSGPPVVGSVVHLPALTYRVASGDTLDGLARIFLAPRDETTPATALAALTQAVGAVDVLTPRAVLALPDISYPIQPGDTLATVAQRFDQTVEQLAEGAKSDAGILAVATATRRMEIPHVASRSLTDLIADLGLFGRFNAVSTTLSRFLLNGMRAPVPPTEGPVAPAAPLWGLYDVAGQQFPAPSATGPYQIDFSKAPGSTATWFGFDPPVGERADSAPVADDLTVTLPAFFFTRHAPAVRLDPLLATGPAPSRLYDEAPARHPLEQVVPWLPAAPVPLPGPTAPVGPSGTVTAVAGGPSLWMFPQTLLDAAGSGPTGVTAGSRPYDLVSAQDTLGGGTTETPLAAYAWATAVPLRITRARDDRGELVHGAYELAGTDPDGRDRLLKAWRYLEASPGHPDRLFLLYRPNGTDPNKIGLVSDTLATGRTLLLKTNLSTETHSGPQLGSVGAGKGAFYASVDTPGAFLRYAWEASITGTGGFHLTYATGAQGAIPEELFAADGSATLWVVLLLDRQSHPGQVERALYAFNNCAVLAENLDASAVRVVARLHDPTPSELVRVPTVPPGVVGFGLARRNPHGATGPTGLTQRLHSLVGYQVVADADFVASHEALPIGPLDKEPAWMGLPPKGPTAHAYWVYEQVVPIARFGTVNDSPRSPALPAADANPYRGVTGPTPGSSRPLSTARLGLAYYDVYGNQTATSQPLPDLTLPVGYTDALVGPAAWPGAAFDYRFLPRPGQGVELDTCLSLQANRYLPGSGNGYRSALRAAAADAERYAAIFYQTQQRDVDFGLASSVGVPRVDDPGRVKAPLLAFTVKARTFAETARTLRQRTTDTPAGQTLAALAENLSVPPTDLLTANAEVAAAALFPATWVRPHLLPAPAMNTLTALAKDLDGRRTGFVPGQNPCAGVGQADRAGADQPTWLRLVSPGEQPQSRRALGGVRAEAQGAAGAVAQDNATQPLTPATVLRTRSRTSSPLDDAGTNSLDDVAAKLGCAVYAEVADPEAVGALLPVGLVVENWDIDDVVAASVVVTVSGASYTTKTTDTLKKTFDALVAQPAAKDLTQAAFGQAIRPIPGLVRPGIRITYATLVVPQPPASAQPGPAAPVFALRDVPADAGTAEELGELNSATTNFFALGAPLLVGFDCCRAGAHDTLADLAEDARLTLGQVAAYNLGVELGAGVTLEIPGLVELPDPDDAWASYTPQATDSLSSVAAVFGVDVHALAATNRQLPGVFAPGARVMVQGTELAADPLDSLESLWRRFGAADDDADAGGDFDAWIDLLAPVVGVYGPAGAFLGPLPTVLAGAGGLSSTLEEVAAGLNLTPAALLAGSSALAGTLREGATVLGPRRVDGGQTSVTVGAYDTIETVRRKLRDQLGSGGVAPSDAELAVLNAGRGGLLRVGARLLPPPPPTPLSVPFDVALPQGPGEASLVFAVTVSVVMTRAAGLVHPDFRGTEAVRRSESRLVPRVGATSSPELSLVPFAQSFEDAFAPQRLKCAVATGAERHGTVGEVWAVNLGPSGIRRVEVDPSRPLFYALRPLSTQTVGGEVEFPVYTSGRGLCGTATKRYENVDLDAWLRLLLVTVDFYLTPSYSVPAVRLGLTSPRSTAAQEPPPEPTSLGTLSSQRGQEPTATLGTGPLVLPGPSQGPIGLVSGRPPVRTSGIFGTFETDGSSGIRATEPAAVHSSAGCLGPTANGPADFDRVVTAKDQLATALRSHVMPVLNTPGATGGVEHEAAREALYQQMLVRLGDAYDVSTVVQFPVRIDSPLPTRTVGPYPPRAAGKVVPALHAVPIPSPSSTRSTGSTGSAGSTPAADSYAGMAGGYGVCTPFLAQITGDLRGLLMTGAVLAGETVRADDTLNRLAGRCGVPVDPAAVGYWQTWQSFVARFADTPAFAPGAVFPLSQAARIVSSGDDFSVFAEFFGCGLDSVARANQHVPGLLRTGALVVDRADFPSPYDVKATDTLVDVAQGVSAANGGRPLAVDLLVVLLRAQQVLRPGGTLRMVDQLPEMSISTAKVSLGPIGASGGPPAPLSFLLTVKDAAQRDKLLLNLDFAVNEVEYAIRDVPGTDRYQASRWLTLVLPLDRSRGGIDAGVRTAIPQVQVPIPLRAYPPPSRLVAQAGVATDSEATDVTTARRWDYSVDVQTRKAAQDTDHLRVAFGETSGLQSAADLNPQLFRWLAAFADAYPRLADDLALLPGLAAGATDPVAAYAVQSLSLLAEQVAAALAAGAGPLATPSDAAEIYHYRMTTLADDVALRSLRLDPESALAGGPPVAGMGPRGVTGTWPTVFVQSTTGGGGTGPERGFLPMPGGQGFYAYPSGFRTDEQLTYRFRFDGRDVIRNTTGRGAIAVTRNDRLVAHGPLGPTGVSGPVHTASDFVYQTPYAEFVDPLMPLIDNDAAIDLSDGSGPRPLTDHLLSLLRQATDVTPASGSPQRIELLCSYGFVLTSATDHPLMATTPVLLVPSRTVSAADVTAFVRGLAADLGDWHSMTEVRTDGQLIFGLTVFSAAEAARPVLRLRNLQLPLTAVTWDDQDPRTP